MVEENNILTKINQEDAISLSKKSRKIKRVRDHILVNQGRFLASLFFPIFPQYWGTNYGETMELMTKADTVGYFVVRHTISVRHLILLVVI